MLGGVQYSSRSRAGSHTGPPIRSATWRVLAHLQLQLVQYTSLLDGDAAPVVQQVPLVLGNWDKTTSRRPQRVRHLAHGLDGRPQEANLAWCGTCGLTLDLITSMPGRRLRTANLQDAFRSSVPDRPVVHIHTARRSMCVASRREKSA